MPTSALSDSALLLTIAVAAIIAAVAIVVAVGFRLTRANRDLASDAERATFRTLHTATAAGTELRHGLAPSSATKASKLLRPLLNCSVFALTDTDSLLAWDGSGTSAKAPASDAVMELAQQALGTGRTQVLRLNGAASSVSLDHLDPDIKVALVCPIIVEDRSVGTVIVLNNSNSAGLVRASREVASWVASQLALGELSSSRAALAEAEVKALRAQISPHFIYNSLNAIASYITTDPARARDLVVEFADFTRYSFRRHGEFTTVAEELLCIDRYLLLEGARFGDRLKVNLQIAPEVLGTVIPFLSLQPLIENAVRHGLEAKEGTGTISIRARDLGAHAQLSVEDDGVGIDPAHLATVLAGRNDGAHVGLRNVDARLRQVYGEDNGLVIDTGIGHGTLVTVTVPKNQPGNEA